MDIWGIGYRRVKVIRRMELKLRLKGWRLSVKGKDCGIVEGIVVDRMKKLVVLMKWKGIGIDIVCIVG